MRQPMDHQPNERLVHTSMTEEGNWGLGGRTRTGLERDLDWDWEEGDLGRASDEERGNTRTHTRKHPTSHTDWNRLLPATY